MNLGLLSRTAGATGGSIFSDGDVKTVETKVNSVETDGMVLAIEAEHVGEMLICTNGVDSRAFVRLAGARSFGAASTFKFKFHVAAPSDFAAEIHVVD